MNNLKVGQYVTMSRKVTQEDIERFAEFSMDRNPIHFDDHFAENSFFKKRIAHGMIGVALISGCLTELAGPGNIWLSSNYRFLKPIYIGDLITATLMVREVNRRGIISMGMKIENQKDDLLVSGEVQSMRATGVS